MHTDFSGLETLSPAEKFATSSEVGTDRLLFVATDRISAFDYVLATGIPQKGRVLTQLSLFWFDFLKSIVPNHLVTSDVSKYPAELQKYAGQLHGRSMLVVRADMVAIECVVRGYLSGSGWKEYKASGSVCGINLPTGLRESDKLPEPIFTPAIKASSGHDENISFDHMVTFFAGRELSEQLRDLSVANLQDRSRLRRNAGHHHRRYQVRVWAHGARAGAGPRRGAHAGLVALLAQGQVSSRRGPGVV